MLLRDLPIKNRKILYGTPNMQLVRAIDDEIDDVAILGASSAYAAETDDHLLLCILGDV